MSEWLETVFWIRENAPLLFYGGVFVFGACIGSFLNVVIYRIPAGRSVVFPGSHCACSAPIRWRDNLPILSWLLLRGRARCCGRSVSARYPAVEALTGLLIVAVWWRFDPLLAAVFSLYAASMVALSFIDLDTMEIPDRFSVGGFLIGLFLAILVPSMHGVGSSGILVVDSMRSLIVALQGAFIGSGLILWVALVAEVALKKEAMGFGDVKLMGASGAFCGWQGAVFALFGGAVVGTLVVIPCLLVHWLRRNNSASTKIPSRTAPAAGDEAASPGELEDGWRIPFGPSLAAGSLIYLLLLSAWFDDYLDTFASLLASL